MNLEFYYFPEFLENGNEIDFGMKQNGEPVADVTLPPWASTTQEFVDISRKYAFVCLVFDFKNNI